MGIFKKITKNMDDYKDSKKNPIVVKGNRISVKEMRKAYFNKYPASYFKRMSQSVPMTELIVGFNKEGFWLNEIIILNLDKDYEQIRKVLFGDKEKQDIKYTEIRGELEPIIELKEKKSKISKILKLP